MLFRQWQRICIVEIYLTYVAKFHLASVRKNNIFSSLSQLFVEAIKRHRVWYTLQKNNFPTIMDLSFYVIQPLISNIKTGNVWHDCLLITIALFCLTFVSKSCNYGMVKLQSFIASITWRRLKARYSINIIVNPNSYLDTRMQVTSRNILFEKISLKIFLNIGSRRIFGSSPSSSYDGCEYMFGQIHPDE